MKTVPRHSYPAIVFVGAHMEAYAPFQYLIERGSNITGLVTLDCEGIAQMSGGTDLTELAEAAPIPVLRVRSVNQPDSVEWIRSLAPDILLVVGWTQLVKDALLAIPKLACLGFHASLLPKYRGRAPVNWAIINGETETGNTMIVLEAEADSGDIVAQRRIPIADQDDCCTIYQKAGDSEVEMIKEVLPMLEMGILPRRKQDQSQSSVMPRRRPEDGVIDWNRSTRDIYNWIRALTAPYPGAFAFLNGEQVWIWKSSIEGEFKGRSSVGPGEVKIDSQGWPWISTLDGWIRVVSAQRAGEMCVPGQTASETFLAAKTEILQNSGVGK